jgi:HD-GYP domain-containing protein (c-di-GMP phosphodiesterase class II)
MASPANALSNTAALRARRALRRRLLTANRELWLILAMFAIAMLVNALVSEHRMVLYLYTIPTIISAYSFGRRHAVLTAFASAFLILCVSWVKPALLTMHGIPLQIEAPSEFVIWAGLLVIIAYLMGTLYERLQTRMRDLHQSYDGLLMLLQHVASDTKYTHNHPYRVSLMASKIAEQMDLSEQHVDDVRRAALLHDVEKVGITKEMLFQAANFQEEELKQVQDSIDGGKQLPVAQGSSLQRIIPILLAFQAADEKAKESHGMAHIPVESKILLVACHYDQLTTAPDKRISPSEAMERIAQRSGIEYDSEVVDAITRVFRLRGMDEHELATQRVAVAKS